MTLRPTGVGCQLGVGGVLGGRVPLILDGGACAVGLESTVLDLSETQITDAGLKELVGLKNLQTLKLGFTRVTDAGLVTLRALPRLRSLYLWQTDVTAGAVVRQ